MGQHKKEGRVKKGGIFFVKLYLPFEIISRVVEGIDLIHPEGFLVEGIESKSKSYEKTEDKNKNFIPSCAGG